MARYEIRLGVPYTETSSHMTFIVIPQVLSDKEVNYEIRLHLEAQIRTKLQQIYNWSQQQANDFINEEASNFTLNRFDKIKAMYQGQPLDLRMNYEDFRQVLDKNTGIAKGA